MKVSSVVLISCLLSGTVSAANFVANDDIINPAILKDQTFEPLKCFKQGVVNYTNDEIEQMFDDPNFLNHLMALSQLKGWAGRLTFANEAQSGFFTQKLNEKIRNLYAKRNELKANAEAQAFNLKKDKDEALSHAGVYEQEESNVERFRYFSRRQDQINRQLSVIEGLEKQILKLETFKKHCESKDGCKKYSLLHGNNPFKWN